jgi:CelD/BcsL family acetyltransferase involved in cellulose biosynthesis
VRKDSVEIHDSIELVKAEWENLARQTKSKPFLWPGWVGAWWDAFGKGRLRILAAYQGDRLVGVVPLQWSGGVLSSTENEETPLFVGFLAANEAAVEQLSHALFSQGARQIALAFLGSGEGVISSVRAVAEAAGYEVLARPAQKVPYVDLRETTWEAYESGLGRNLRQDLRRRRRRLEEEGKLTLEIFDGKERLEELLEEGFRLEGSGWKEAQGTSINTQPAVRLFYTQVAHWAAERGWLQLAFLRLDQRTIAFDYCLENNKIHYMLKIGYDPAYGKFSPGKVLRHLMIARAFSKGITTYELLGAFEPWKRKWSNAYYELWSLHMFTREGLEQNPWYYQLHFAIREIAELVPPGESFVLVDEDSWRIDAGNGRRAIPFLERDELYWGPPPDDETAIGELERLRENGATFMVFGWPAFWWLEYYAGLHRYLRTCYRCLLENERVVVFDLRQG